MLVAEGSSTASRSEDHGITRTKGQGQRRRHAYEFSAALGHLATGVTVVNLPAPEDADEFGNDGEPYRVRVA